VAEWGTVGARNAGRERHVGAEARKADGRAAEPGLAGPGLAFGPFEVEPARRRLLHRGELVQIQPKVLDLLLLLLRHRDRVVGREEIRRALWPDLAVANASLDRLVKELRRALDDDGRRQRWIRTYHGRGLRFEGPVGELPLREAGPEPRARRARRTLEHAERELATGNVVAAREGFRTVAESARRIAGAVGAELLGRAALGVAGVRIGYDPPDEGMATLLGEAAERLGAEHRGLRARVVARLAAEERVAAPRDRLAELHRAALGDAVAAEDDPTALAEVLATPIAGIWECLAPGRRLRLAAEAAARAQRAGARQVELRARWLRLLELLAAGEIVLFDTELAEITRWAEEAAEDLDRYGVACLHIARAVLAGRLQDAELLASEAFLISRRHNDRSALDLYGTQLIVIRAEQGRLDELVEPTAAAAAQTAAVSPRCLLAWIHARRGDAPAARAVLAEIERRDLPRLADAPVAAANAGVLAEVAGFLGDGALASGVAPLLEPERGRLLLRGVTAVHGPADFFRGHAAAAEGRARDARRAFGEAAALAERLKAPLWAAAARKAQAALGRPRRTRGAAGSHAALRAPASRPVPPPVSVPSAGSRRR